MGKERWRQAPGKGNVDRPIEPKRLGRWREKAEVQKPTTSNVRLFAGIFSLVMVVALIVAAILVLRPLPKPYLVLLSAKYRVPLLDANAFAIDDAKTLLSLNHLVDSGHTDAESLDTEEMLDRIAAIPDMRPMRSWFGSAPTATVVYVNALGFAAWDDTARRAVPYVVADDFQVPTRLNASDLGQAVKVRDILDALAKASAERKLLVLDCQRVDSLWPLGVLANQFIEAVREEIKTLSPESRRGLYVLSSSSDGEVTWPDRQVGQSAFGRFWIQGLQGEADKTVSGNSDGYVTVGELADFASQRVSDWARQRADIQRPVLLYADDIADAGEVRLVAIPWRKPSAAAPGPAADPAVIDKIRAGWQSYYNLAKREPAPWHHAPQYWRLIEETLMRTEEFYRAGDLDAVEEELSTLARRQEEVKQATAAVVEGSGLSFPMDKFVATLAPGDETKAETAANPFEAALDALVRGESFDAFKTKFSQGALVERLAPAEAYMALQLAQSPFAADQQDLAHRLIKLRLAAESAATPAGRWSADVHPWLIPHLSQADTARRLLEDQFLLHGANPIPTGAGTVPLSIDVVEQTYQRAEAHGKVVAQAMEVRERLLAELPHLTRFVSRRAWGSPWASSDEPFRSNAHTLYESLVRSLASVNRRLAIDPSKLTPDKIDVEVASLDQSRIDLQKNRTAIFELVAAETRKLGKTAVAAQTEILWRRMSDLLLVPAASSPENPDESARTRVNLLARVCEPVLQAGEGSAGGGRGREVGNIDVVDPNERRQQVRRMTELASELYRVGVGLAQGEGASADLDSMADTVQMGWLVGQWWRQTRDLAVSRQIAPDRRDELYRADTARRLIEGYVSRSDVRPPTIALQRLNLADYFAWQGSRLAEDFWARQPGQNRDYFDLTAQAQLERARELHPTGEAAYVSLADRVNELKKLASSLAVTADRSTVRFTVRDEEPIQITPNLPAALPIGVAGLSAGITPSTVQVRGQGNSFQVIRGDTREGTANFAANLFFRGHRAAAAVPVILSDDENGPTVVYQDKRPTQGTYSIRLAESDKSDLKLLFILDCSASMREPAGSTGSSKIAELRETLTRFAEDTPAGAIDAGVRWLGSRVQDRKDDTGGSKDTMRVLDIGPFAPEKFKAKIPSANADLGAWTPLFEAIIQARRDFDGVAGNRQIVVISDGLDGFVTTALGRKISDIEAAYAGSGIRINTVGFFFDDKTQLSEIAAKTNGKYIPITDSSRLLKELTGLTGILNFTAQSSAGNFSVPAEPAKLVSRPSTYDLAPGFFQVLIKNSEGKSACDPFAIRVRGGDLHELVYKNRRLEYSDDFLDQGTAVPGPDGKVHLRVLRCRPAADGVDLAFALYKPEEMTWQPEIVNVAITPEGKNQRYTFHQLAPNMLRTHVPAWELMLEQWPQDSSTANFVISWSDPPSPIEIDVSRPTSSFKVAPGVELGNPRYIAPPEDVKIGTTAIFKMSFDAQTRASMSDWYIALPYRVRKARQIYNATDGIYTGYFTVEGVDKIDRVLVYPPKKPDAQQVITTRIDVTTPAVQLNDDRADR